VQEGVAVRVLVTGFEPFGEDKINPSGEIVKKLAKDSNFLKKHSSHEFVFKVLPVSYERSIAILEEIYSGGQFDFSLHLGQAGGTTTVTLERVAVNLMDSEHPDNDNVTKLEEVIIPEAADALLTKINVKALVQYLNKNKIPAVISYTAGQYICNEVYYYSLSRSHKTSNPKQCLFVHLPFVPEQVAWRYPKNRNTPSMCFELQYKAVRKILTWYLENCL